MFPSSVELRKPPPKHPLKKLLDQIRSQRNQLEHEPAAEWPAGTTEEIPEKDATIDTGSLTSEERSAVLPLELHQTTPDGKTGSVCAPRPTVQHISGAIVSFQRGKHPDRPLKQKQKRSLLMNAPRGTENK